MVSNLDKQTFTCLIGGRMLKFIILLKMPTTMVKMFNFLLITGMFKMIYVYGTNFTY